VLLDSLPKKIVVRKRETRRRKKEERVKAVQVAWGVTEAAVLASELEAGWLEPLTTEGRIRRSGFRMQTICRGRHGWEERLPWRW